MCSLTQGLSNLLDACHSLQNVFKVGSPSRRHCLTCKPIMIRLYQIWWNLYFAKAVQNGNKVAHIPQMLVGVCECSGHTCAIYRLVDCQIRPEVFFQVFIPTVCGCTVPTAVQHAQRDLNGFMQTLSRCAEISRHQQKQQQQQQQQQQQ